MICNNANCDYIGHPLYKKRGDLLTGFILLALFFPAGIFYLMFKCGTRRCCPKCKQFWN